MTKGFFKRCTQRLFYLYLFVSMCITKFSVDQKYFYDVEHYFCEGKVLIATKSVRTFSIFFEEKCPDKGSKRPALSDRRPLFQTLCAITPMHQKDNVFMRNTNKYIIS